MCSLRVQAGNACYLAPEKDPHLRAVRMAGIWFKAAQGLVACSVAAYSAISDAVFVYGVCIN